MSLHPGSFDHQEPAPCEAVDGSDEWSEPQVARTMRQDLECDSGDGQRECRMSSAPPLSDRCPSAWRSRSLRSRGHRGAHMNLATWTGARPALLILRNLCLNVGGAPQFRNERQLRAEGTPRRERGRHGVDRRRHLPHGLRPPLSRGSARASGPGRWLLDRPHAPVTNREFRRFVDATGHVTVAERAPEAKDYPGAPRTC